MTRAPISPGHAAAMGSSGQMVAAALAPSGCWTGTAQWDFACRVTRTGDFRSETNCKASWHRTARGRRSSKRCFLGHRRSSTGQARRADRPMMGRVLSDRHANVEFSEDDAVCRAHGANRSVTDTLSVSQRRRSALRYVCAKLLGRRRGDRIGGDFRYWPMLSKKSQTALRLISW